MNRKNQVVILRKHSDPDDGMCCVDTGCINGYGEESYTIVAEKRLAENYVDGFLRKSGNTEYTNNESLLRAFLEYLNNLELEP